MAALSSQSTDGPVPARGRGSRRRKTDPTAAAAEGAAAAPAAPPSQGKRASAPVRGAVGASGGAGAEGAPGADSGALAKDPPENLAQCPICLGLFHKKLVRKPQPQTLSERPPPRPRPPRRPLCHTNDAATCVPTLLARARPTPRRSSITRARAPSLAARGARRQRPRDPQTAQGGRRNPQEPFLGSGRRLRLQRSGAMLQGVRSLLSQPAALSCNLLW